MINFKNVEFVKTTPSLKLAPKTGEPEVLIVGKSNVGKSSLINALVGRKQLAFTSSKPGHTRLLNYYLIDKKFFLVDAPGYGYAKTGVDLDEIFGEMMNDYLANAHNLKLVLLLVDCRRELNENDMDILSYLLENNIPYQLVITKVDKVNQSEKAKLNHHLESIGVTTNKICYTSSKVAKSLTSLKGIIEKAL